MNPNNGKKSYESIEIPTQLKETIQQTIASKNKEELQMRYHEIEQEATQNTRTEQKKQHRPVWRNCAAAAAVVLLAGTIGLNSSPAFAEDMSKVPVIGALAQVLTFRSFHGTEGDVVLNVNIPVIKGMEGQALPEQVNAQIQKLTADYEAQAKAEMAEYREAFFSTGGTEEEWAARTMDLTINYDVKYYKEDILSLEVTTAKGWVYAEEARNYYNIDLKHDTALTLEDMMGEDYIAICNESILKQIDERMAADENALFFGFGENADEMDAEWMFRTIDDTTPFYLNADGDVVISFPEYSIAPGYMGIQEFVIG